MWLKFKGGKGVAAFLGLLSIVSWPLSIAFCIIWTISVKIFKYSGAGAIIAIIVNILIFKLILHIQFNYKILYWVPGTYFEYNVILFFHSNFNKHIKISKAFSKNNCLDLENSSDNFLFLR